MRFAPVEDGYAIPAPVLEAVAHRKHNDVATLTGANLGELGGLTPSGIPVTAEAFRAQAKQRYGESAGEFLKLYPASTDAQAVLAQGESARDQALVAMYLWGKHHIKYSKTKVFEYLWDHPMPGPDAARFGAFHTSEVPYVLNTLYKSDRPFADADRTIADMMSSYWANFAATGDPNGKGLPRWSAVGDKHEVMELGDKTGPVAVAGSPEKFKFFETFLTK